jgi:dTMP kinase
MGPLKKGILITIEGIDGVGKSSQAASLAEFLRAKGYEVVELKEPTDGVWGKKIKNLSKKGRNVSPREECNWFLQDRVEDVKDNINPALESKMIIIMDRYYYSNMAYQGALGLDPEKIQEKNEKFSPRPDLVIILDASPEIGLDRIKNQRKEDLNYFEDLDYQIKVREIFLGMKDFENVRIIDAGKTKDEVQKDIRELVCEFFELG